MKGSVQGDINIDIDVDVQVEVDVNVDRYFGCFKGASKSVQVPLHGIEADIVLTSIIQGFIRRVDDKTVSDLLDGMQPAFHATLGGHVPSKVPGTARRGGLPLQARRRQQALGRTGGRRDSHLDLEGAPGGGGFQKFGASFWWSL